jgi:hypothetical protein
MAPQILAVFPAVARQVLRGDVRESDVLAIRKVHVPSLFEGRLGFEDQVAQGYDDKEFDSGAVPARALAAARCAVAFTDRFEETPPFDLRPYLKDESVVSSTGQLRWTEGEGGERSGFFTLNTDGTKGVVGFARGQVCRLGEVTITPDSRFAAIYVTAPDPRGRVVDSRRLLITALARARNTAMKFSPGGGELLDRGHGPVLMEPVAASITFQGRRVVEVRLLDHDGRRTAKTLTTVEGQFTLDGRRDQTPYYEVTME